MANSKTLFNDFISRIGRSDDPGESDAMAYMVFENVLGLTRVEVLAGKSVSVSHHDQAKLGDIVARLNAGEPVQYILGEAFFFRRKFMVNPHVLIPRPETEELVDSAIRYLKELPVRPVTAADIGTGSGCIAITLALEMPDASVHATDISEGALQTAAENARRLNAAVNFQRHDILSGDLPFEGLDLVVSNPPYVTPDEEKKIKDNVLRHEPHLALFVPSGDPLLFYKAIAAKAFAALKPAGLAAVEINERFGNETKSIFLGAGFDVVKVQKDIAGKDRIVTARKPKK